MIGVMYCIELERYIRVNLTHELFPLVKFNLLLKSIFLLVCPGGRDTYMLVCPVLLLSHSVCQIRLKYLGL